MIQEAFSSESNAIVNVTNLDDLILKHAFCLE